MIKIYGDSHAAYFNLTDKVRESYPRLKIIRNKDFKLSVAHGASVKGLGKKKSRLNMAKVIGESIEIEDTLVLNFGQVDLELGFYYELVIKGKSVSPIAYVEELIRVYIKFLLEIRKKVKRIIIKGVNIPVFRYKNFALNYVGKIITENIKSEEDAARKKNILSSEILDIVEATNMSLLFNSLLKKFSENNSKIGYFDLTEFLISNDGKIKNEYIPSNFDHHIIDSLYIRNLHWKQLLKTLESI